MSEAELLKRLFAPSASREVRLLAASGLIPLSPADLLLALVRLAQDADPETADKASETLSGWTEPEIISQLQSPECSPEISEHFASCDSHAIREAIVLNRATPGAVIAKFAPSISAPLLEMVLYNRTRILETPEILEGIRRNPAATPRILGTVQEIETEFFGSKAHDYEVAVTENRVPVSEETTELVAEDLQAEDLALEGLPVDPQEREAAILSRIASMTVRQKIQLALMGTREARAVLVRDTNKEVARAVLQSPKLTLVEIEAFSTMRSVAEDVLRLISNSKAWTKSYAVVHNLVRNPKTPPAISQRLIMRLQTRDLMMLARDRGISEAVRRNAERLVKQRGKNQPIG